MRGCAELAGLGGLAGLAGFASDALSTARAALKMFRSP
jgi:hypothetical protein